jgi:hypothetical protein
MTLQVGDRWRDLLEEWGIIINFKTKSGDETQEGARYQDGRTDRQSERNFDFSFKLLKLRSVWAWAVYE